MVYVMVNIARGTTFFAQIYEKYIPASDQVKFRTDARSATFADGKQFCC